MMKFTIAAVVATVLVIATIAAADQHPLYKWEHIPSPATVSDSADFFHSLKFYLPLRNEKLLATAATPSTAELEQLALQHDVGCATDAARRPLNAEDAVSVRLALWRRVLHPSCSAIESARSFLKARGVDSEKQCVLEYDHIKCDHLTVAQVKALFKIASASIRRVHETRAKTVFAPRLTVGSIGDALEKHATIPYGIFSFIGGLQVGTEAQQPRSHMASNHRAAAAAETPSVGAYNPSFAPVGGNVPHIIGFQSHSITSLPNEPASNFFFSSFLVDLPCNAPNSWAQISPVNNTIYCDNDVKKQSSYLPLSMTIEVRRTHDDALLATEVFPLNFSGTVSNCVRANLTGTGSGSQVVCPLYSKSNIALPLWQPVYLSISATLDSKGTKKGPSYAQAYYNESYFGFSNVFPNATGFGTQTGRLPALSKENVVFQITPGATTITDEYRSMYKVPSNYPTAVSEKILQGVLEFPGGGGGGFGNGYNKTDVLVYMARLPGGSPWFKPEMIEYLEGTAYGPTTVPAVDGAPGESQLDIQMVAGMGRGIKSVFWVFNATNNNFAVDGCDWMQLVMTQGGALAKLKYAPTTWSVSYGSSETSDKTSTEAMTRSQTYAAAASSAGVSIFISSGDAGSAPAGGATLVGSYPASLPAVISVGATAKRMDAAGKMFTDISSALLGDLITSGGGPSAFFTVPDHQKSIYESGIYATLPASLGKGMRMTPDISAIGAFIMIVLNGQNISVSGTSASSPISMALLTLVNNELAAQNREPLRDVAKLFGTQGKTLFTDVVSTTTTGSARGFGNNIQCFPSISWTGTVGYDAATGFGVPKFPEILSAAQKEMPVVTPAPNSSNKTLAPGTANTTTEAPGSHSSAESPASKLKGGAIAGIAVGSVVFVLILALLWWRKKATSQGDGLQDLQGSGEQQTGYGTAPEV